MSPINSQSTDALFADPEAESSWPAPQAPSTDEVTERMEQTLDLIADAANMEIGIRAFDSYDLTLIIPVFNERETLPKVLERIDEVMPPATQIVIVDDGSMDGTSEWLARLPERPGRKVVRRRSNHGKGSAVRLAIRHSTGRVVAIQDADLEYDPADLLGAVWPILEGKAKVVYGSRYLGESDDASSLHRFGNWMLTRISNLMTGLHLTDMETCHKAFDGDLLRSIPLRECRFGFEPEITAKIAQRGVRVIEVATGYNSRGYEEGKKIGWRDAISALACMWKYRKESGRTRPSR